MDNDGVLADQTVVVADGKIASIAPASQAQVPAGAVKVDGKGRTLMPGLGELHAHIPGGKAPETEIERTLFLYVANGVTTIRGMLGDPRHLVYRDRVATSEVLGPRIYTSGPSFNGNSAKTPDAAVSMVIEQHRRATTCSRFIQAFRATPSTRWPQRPTNSNFRSPGTCPRRSG